MAHISEQATFFLQTHTRTIVTRGEAEIKVRPDRVVFTLSAEKTDPNMAAATNYVEDIFRKIFEVVRKHHLPESKVQTGSLTIQPQVEYETTRYGWKERKVTKIAVRKVVTIILENEVCPSRA